MFRVQSHIGEYPSDPLDILPFELNEGDLIIDHRLRYGIHSVLVYNGSPFPNSRVMQGNPSPEIDFANIAERTLIQAYLASENADSYRNFNVGAIIFAELEPGIFGIFHGANSKPTPDSEKKCAEKVALEKALKHGATRIIGVAVYGPAQEDHGSGLELPVLHPCEVCRKMFMDCEIVDNRMLISSANEKGQFEMSNLETILAIHEYGVDPSDPEQISTHRVPLKAASILLQHIITGAID